jgi:hypothetical protein
MACLILLYPVLLRIATSETERVKKEGCIEVKKNEENEYEAKKTKLS